MTMANLIGGSEQFSTWGRCRTPIFNTTTGIGGNLVNHNLEATNGFAPAAGGFFRCANWPSLVFWTDGSGLTQTGIQGAVGFAFNTPSTPPAGFFYVGAYNADPSQTYAPNYLDDDEVQGIWVGRNVVLDSGTYAMDYTALNGVYGSTQSVAPTTTNINSFDL